MIKKMETIKTDATKKRKSQVLYSSLASASAASTSMNCSTRTGIARLHVEGGGEGISAKMLAISSA
jgi:hypothetical protein